MTLNQWRARLVSLWRGHFHAAQLDAQMSEEFKHHIELRRDDLIRRGFAPDEASRRARIEFGHVSNYKSDARAARGLGPFEQVRFSILDVKLGARMLRKYPGLSAVAVVGMTVATAIGAGAFSVLSAVADPTLPLPGGDRIVAVENSIIGQASRDRQTSQDLFVWRNGMTSIRDLAAFASEQRNLAVAERAVDLITVARMTATGFRVAGVSPIRGRWLVDEDERPGAPPVVVIAYEEWQQRFNGDPAIIGRRVRLGTEIHTVVGVMPEGFRFPISHRFWIPLGLNSESGPLGSPSLFIFGRLAEGATHERAQAEADVIGSQMAAAFPSTHGDRRPRVVPYAHAVLGLDGPGAVWTLRTAEVALSLLLMIVAANVAILLYARTATRAGEIAVRAALGASRRRIVAQLFAEALVLSLTAALVGLAVVGVGLFKVREIVLPRDQRDAIPFWLDFGLSPTVVAYALGLAVVAALIAGVLPALQATGPRVQLSLQQLSGHGARMQLGRTWTALIIMQVALAVGLLPFGIAGAADMIQQGLTTASYPIDEFLRASLTLQEGWVPAGADSAAKARAVDERLRAGARELLRRLKEDPAVAGVTYASDFPGLAETRRLEIDQATRSRADTSTPVTSVRASVNRVAPDLFEVFDLPIRAGRGFVAADVHEASTAVIVDQVFADRFLGDAGIIGRRIRFVDIVGSGPTEQVARGPWLEIVGLAPSLLTYRDPGEAPRMLYRAVSPDQLTDRMSLMIRVNTVPSTAFAARLRQIAAEVDPGLQLRGLEGAADRHRRNLSGERYMALGMSVAMLSVLLLSGAGIHAVMSFTVAKRRREIGIRSALGASSRSILFSIFVRSSGQLGAGVIVGLIGALAVNRVIWDGTFDGNAPILLPSVVVLMVTVGLLAALGPARRGLLVQPTEALRAD